MKKEIKIVICIFLAIWFFFMGFELGSYYEKRTWSKQPETTEAPVVTTVPTLPSITTATTAAPTTTKEKSTSESGSSSTTKGNTKGTTKKPAETTTKKNSNDVTVMTKEEIVKAVSDAVNTVKAKTDFTAVKTENIKINVTDISVPAALRLVNNVINNVAGDEKITYNFVGGKAIGIDQDGNEVEDEGEVTPNNVIMPKDAPFTLTADGVKSATATKAGDNTTYNLFLVEESTTFDQPIPKNNNAAYSYLDLTKLDLTGVTIKEANMHYPKTQITAVVDKNGRLTIINYLMPMDGNGSARFLAFNGDATFEGSDTETWVFKY